MKITDRKSEIIVTAAKLFKKRGYNAVSMRDIAQELGIKAASLYNHIKSKQEILSDIVLNVAESFTNHMEQIYPQSINSIQKLEAIIQNHIDITVQKTDFLACMNNDWMHLDEENLATYLKLRNAYEASFRKILQEGIAKNELENQNSEIVIFSILTTLRALYLWYSKKSSVEVEVLKKDLPKTLLHGIVKN
ncbi:transcriptional regulator, TetR family [Mesonia phycicola]|uniref:Transcriptional regulator, TetR family n=1 Tax=Mesonia phycicola TaxID=579105 RepID=A0A1M6G1K1_9FLAO|nr:TetR/AcrR family transcriptional regulator [Mesonia phycicola]SHJ03747.1 transcriptional regulator, TetR family [Mesonia phycicola]